MAKLSNVAFWLIAALVALLVLAPAAGGADVQIANAGIKEAGGVYPFALEARNADCSEPQDFRFEPRGVSWLKLPQGNVARGVAQGETRSLPAELDFTRVPPGRYSGEIDIICETCGWWLLRTCHIDKQTVTLRVEVTAPRSSTVAGSVPATMPRHEEPKFSCCETNIRITGITPKPGSTAQRSDGFEIEIDMDLNIALFCDFREEDNCLGYYEVTVSDSAWEEFKDGKWVPIDSVNVREPIVHDPHEKLKWECDNRNHAGVWSFTYFADFVTKNPVRSTKLVISLDVPADKGQSYDASFDIAGVSGKTGEKPPNVKLKELKKKKAK